MIADDVQLARTSVAEAGAFRAALDAAGYTELNVANVLGALEMPTRRARNLPRLRRSCHGDSGLHALIRLFFIGLPVEVSAAERALEPVPLKKWAKANLLQVADGLVRGLVRLVPYGEILLTIDPPELVETGAAPDIVTGMTGSSLTLLYFTIRRRFRSILDLGTGCGIQALLAAGHGQRVLATDRSARSINFARFNATLNGRANIDFGLGDAFAPARRRKFDLIVSNPPFMISPGMRYMYRDSGLEGDGFCRKLAREAPRYLREGGFFQMTCEWIHPENADWQERLAEWFEGSGCDVLVLRTETQSPAVYADQWLRDTEQDNPELWVRLYDEYVDYYRSLGIQAIGTGVIAMRRRSATANRIRFEDAPPQKPEPFGESIAMAFELADALERLRDDRLLLAERLRLAPDVRLEQQLQCHDGVWRPVGTRLSLVRGIRFHGEVDQHATRLVARCTGEVQFAEIVSAIARELRLSFDRVAAPSLALARGLIQRGFLLPEAAASLSPENRDSNK
ncbi:MAG: class I SAM-dependent methyltransferase [Bryobacterales bacterium]|nr:class I SAM-dependent methyltransferase [Bryobacterales bacterium]